MQQTLEEYWTVFYRTVTVTPTDLSEEFGSQWDDVQYGPWEEVGINFPNRGEASKAYWAYGDQGYDVRIHHIRLVKQDITTWPYKKVEK